MWKQRYFAGFSNMFRDLGPAGIGGHLPISAHKWLFFAIFDKLHDWDATFLRFWARNIVFFGVSAILHVWLYLYGAKNDKLSRFWSVSIILVCFDLEILKCLMPHTPLPCITVHSDKKKAKKAKMITEQISWNCFSNICSRVAFSLWRFQRKRILKNTAYW